MITTTLTNQPIAEIEGKLIGSRCLKCGLEFQAHRMQLYDRVFIASCCDQCADLRDSRATEWCLLCPFEYRLDGNKEGGGHTRLERMDHENPNWRKVLDWQYGSKGLLIRGETGRLKTRAMWRLIRQLFDQRQKIIALTSA